MDIILSADKRDLNASKHKLKKSGLVLGCIYSKSTGSMPIQLNGNTLKKCLKQGATKIHLKVDGKKYMAAIEEVQKNSVGSEIVHVSFHCFSANEKVSIHVPVHLVGKAAGQEEGGVLSQQLSEVTLYGYAADIPDSLNVDVSTLKLGSSLHISELPKGKYEIKDSADKVIVACNYVRVEKETPAAVVEAAPEVDTTETVAAEAAPALTVASFKKAA